MPRHAGLTVNYSLTNPISLKIVCTSDMFANQQPRGGFRYHHRRTVDSCSTLEASLWLAIPASGFEPSRTMLDQQLTAWNSHGTARSRRHPQEPSTDIYSLLSAQQHSICTLEDFATDVDARPSWKTVHGLVSLSSFFTLLSLVTTRNVRDNN